MGNGLNIDKRLLAVSFAALLAVGCSSKSVDTDTSADDAGTDAAATETGSTSGAATTYGADANDAEASTYGGEAESSLSSAEQALLGTTIFYFDFDKSNLRSETYAALRAHAAYLASNPGARVRLEGHADERGTREYNIALGERRGDAVANFLRVNGGRSNQSEVISYGEEKPAAFGSSESTWQKNRRVELVYTQGRP